MLDAYKEKYYGSDPEIFTDILEDPLFSANENLLLDWDDIVWLHKSDLALRSIGSVRGHAELKSGVADGDSHALANFGLNPALNPWISHENVSEIFQKIKNGEIDEDPALKLNLTQYFNVALLQTAAQCYADHNANGLMFLLVKNKSSKIPYDLNQFYFFGKCGKGTNGEIISYLQAGVHFGQKVPNGSWPKNYDEAAADVASIMIALTRLIKSRPSMLVIEPEKVVQIKQRQHEDIVEILKTTADWATFKNNLKLYQLEWSGTHYNQMSDIYNVPANPIPEIIEEAMAKIGDREPDAIKAELPNSPVYNDLVKSFIDRAVVAQASTRKPKNM